MASVLAYSGIRDTRNVFSKLNFQDPKDVRNLNASIPNYLAGLSMAATNGYGDFGVMIDAENAALGSLKKDFGSAGKLLRNLGHLIGFWLTLPPDRLRFAVAQACMAIRITSCASAISVTTTSTPAMMAPTTTCFMLTIAPSRSQVPLRPIIISPQNMVAATCRRLARAGTTAWWLACGACWACDRSVFVAAFCMGSFRFQFARDCPLWPPY